MSDLHYVFEDDKVYAIREGKVVAKADNLADLEKVAWMDGGYDGPAYDDHGQNMDPESFGVPQRMHDDPNSPYFDEPCPACGARQGAYEEGNCAACGHQEPMSPNAVHAPEMGTAYDMYDDHPRDPHMGSVATVVGPGGLKGKVLGKVKDLWGEEVAVRFENGRIAHLRVQQDGSLQGGFKESIEKVASATANPVDDLTGRLEVRYETNFSGMSERLAEVDSIRVEALQRMASASPAEQAELDGIRVAAEAERGTLRQALDALEADAAAQAAVAPYEMQAAPAAQATLGRGEGNWLDGVVSAMIAEAEGQDFETIVREGSVLFVADLNEGALADTGVTRDMATRHIRSKTAGLAREQADGIEREFLAKVEEARKATFSERKASIHKEAAVREDQHKDLPDDILFF